MMMMMMMMIYPVQQANIFPLGTGPDDTEKSMIWIAAGVGGFVAVVIMLVAFVVYRVRR